MAATCVKINPRTRPDARGRLVLFSCPQRRIYVPGANPSAYHRNSFLIPYRITQCFTISSNPNLKRAVNLRDDIIAYLWDTYHYAIMVAIVPHGGRYNEFWTARSGSPKPREMTWNN